jgi:hypothetical protein
LVRQENRAGSCLSSSYKTIRYKQISTGIKQGG